MVSLQTRRGETVTFCLPEVTTDLRGNRVERPTSTSGRVTVRASVSYDTSSKAEVPGQVEIDVYTLRTTADLSPINAFAGVFWRGGWWDLTGPPALRNGTRHSRHWTFRVRARPDRPTWAD